MRSVFNPFILAAVPWIVAFFAVLSWTG